MDELKAFSEPLPRWEDDIENGHKEDITCISKSDSNFLATSAYDGQIIIWNMVSGKVFCKMISPKPDGHQEDNLDGDLSVNKIIFMNKESFLEKNSAHLISSGPWGRVHFWNVFHTQSVLAQFSVNTKPNTQISKMCVDNKFHMLFVADNHGFVSNWNIENYARHHVETEAPTLTKGWRAHIRSITSIEYIETSKVLITGSMDCTIRLWSPTGMYIGTLGQEEIWNLYDTKTYKHPHVPYDVLIDYKSVPEHPLIDQVQTTAEVLLAHKLMDASDNDKESLVLSGSNKIMIDDESIQEKVEQMNIPAEKTGKRLRHEMMMQLNQPDKNKDLGSKNYYHMLKCFDCDDSPVRMKTPVMMNKNKA